MQNLDSDLLRTFLAIADTGSVTAGADRIRRSQSATSLQVKQLESIVGRTLFRRHGRGVALTPEGESLLPVARQVTDTLDASLANLRGERLNGRLRMGIREDHGRAALTRLLADFAARHPDVELQVQCALGTSFGPSLADGKLDLAVFEVPTPGDSDVILRTDHLVWMRSRERAFDDTTTLPVAVFDQDCWWRDVALADLENAGRAYRIVYTSESVGGVLAAVRAGVAAALVGENDAPDDLVPLAGLPGRHPSHLILRRAAADTSAPGDAMANAIRRIFASRDVS